MLRDLGRLLLWTIGCVFSILMGIGLMLIRVLCGERKHDKALLACGKWFLKLGTKAELDERLLKVYEENFIEFEELIGERA